MPSVTDKARLRELYACERSIPRREESRSLSSDDGVSMIYYRARGIRSRVRL